MNNLEILNRFANGLTFAANFIKKFGPHMPDSFGIICPGVSPEFIVFCTVAKSVELRALAASLFGSDGWTKELSYSKTHLDFHKTVEGVRVILKNSEPVQPATEPEIVSL